MRTWATKFRYQKITHLWHQLSKVAFSFFIILSLSSCVKMNDPEVSQEYNNHLVGTVDLHHSVGQSIVTRREGLNGISIWVTTSPIENANLVSGQLIFKLYSSSTDSKPIHATSLTILPTWNNSQIEILLPIQDNSIYKPYYFQIESSGTAVQLLGRNEDAYPYGTAYADGTPIAADLAFRSTYDYDSNAIFQDLSYWSSQADLLLPLGATLFLPGWILLDITGQRRNYRASEKAALSIGLSLTITPVLMLWTTIFHIQWSRTNLFWILGFIAGYYIIRLSIYLYTKCSQFKYINYLDLVKRVFKNNTYVFLNISLLCIISGALFVRFAMVRDLTTPAWVDSVHHATITRLIVQEGGFPLSYTPYMDFNIFNYHVGFHSNLALFSWLSGLDIPEAMLIYGQAINALTSLAVYLLTVTFTRKPLAGLFAALITGFFTPMPAYYTSWGRYTQLAGLIILPTFLSLLRPCLLSGDPIALKKTLNFSSVFLVLISISGLFLVHYRVIAFALLLLIAEFIIKFPLKRAYALNYIKINMITGLVCFLGAILIISPWFFPSFSQVFFPKLSPPETTQAVLFGDLPLSFLTSAYGKQSLILLGLGFVWLSIKNIRVSLTLLLWVTLLILFANLDAFNLPGGGFITGTSVVIMLFIPISLIGGYFFEELFSSWMKILPISRIPLARSSFWITVFIGISLVASSGARQLIPIINPLTILSRQADRDAIFWIRDNINPNEKVLINPFSWGFGLYAGSDGGYWISPMTGMLTIPPPALYGLGSPDTIKDTNSINQITVNPDTTPKDLHIIMTENQIEYVYIGRRGGPFSNNALFQSNLFDQLYDLNGVRIYKLRRVP